jgi:preprotein translocase subunit SecD
VADFALLLNILLIAGGLAAFQATLTLPGIAGIILTIGMAVDANVLIFERIREEITIGKTYRAAVEAGYQRATLTILDANVTTLIAALVLFQFGTGPVKGFAVTLSLGVIASLFTALILTRLIFDYFLLTRKVKTLSI